MGEDLSREVKLAISYVEDAKRKTEALEQESNPLIAQDEAEKILSGELYKARVALQTAEAQGEDVSFVHVEVLDTEGKVMWVVGRAMVELYPKKSKQWAKKLVEKRRELVEMWPTPATHYNYGLALYLADRDTEAVEALRLAENSDDDETSIDATKLISRIQENPSSRGLSCCIPGCLLVVVLALGMALLGVIIAGGV